MKTFTYGYSGAMAPGMLMLAPAKPEAVEGTRGVLWALAMDGECYGVEAEVLYREHAACKISFTTLIPINGYVHPDGAWALVVDGEVIIHGPETDLLWPVSQQVRAQHPLP